MLNTHLGECGLVPTRQRSAARVEFTASRPSLSTHDAQQSVIRGIGGAVSDTQETTTPALAYVTISSTQPERLIDFYTRLLRLEVTFEAGAFTVASRNVAPPVQLAFQRVVEVSQTAVHLDLHVADVDVAGTEVLRLGGRLGDRHEEVGSVWRHAFDPDGNVFCLMSSAPPTPELEPS
jgi:predicted enzyme related to lactoylglutathione lyase